jgi:hypothetical protein
MVVRHHALTYHVVAMAFHGLSYAMAPGLVWCVMACAFAVTNLFVWHNTCAYKLSRSNGAANKRKLFT